MLDPCLASVLGGSNHGKLPQHVTRVESVVIGSISVPTGRIVACDPFWHFMQPPPFTRLAPIGRHPLRLVLAHDANNIQRVAAAQLEFSSVLAERWELAVLPEQKEYVGALLPGEFFGYAVDSGTGSFMDAAAGQRLAAVDSVFMSAVRKQMERVYRSNRSWAVIDLDGGLNAGVFSSGDGDGRYGSYWGLAAR